MHTNHPGVLLKCRPDSADLRWAWESAFLTCFQWHSCFSKGLMFKSKGLGQRLSTLAPHRCHLGSCRNTSAWVLLSDYRTQALVLLHSLKCDTPDASDVQPGVGLPRGAVRSDAGVTSNFGVEELRFISYVEGGSGGCNMWWFVFIKRKRHRERESLYGARKLYGWRRTRLGQPDTGRKPGSSTSYSGWVTYLLCTPVFSSVRWAVVRIWNNK